MKQLKNDTLDRRSFIKAAGAMASSGLSFLQKSLGITRTQKAADALGNEAYFGPAAEHTRNWLKSEGYSDAEIIKRMDW